MRHRDIRDVCYEYSITEGRWHHDPTDKEAMGKTLPRFVFEQQVSRIIEGVCVLWRGGKMTSSPSTVTSFSRLIG